MIKGKGILSLYELKTVFEFPDSEIVVDGNVVVWRSQDKEVHTTDLSRCTIQWTSIADSKTGYPVVEF
jgi:hypothetical protein